MFSAIQSSIYDASAFKYSSNNNSQVWMAFLEKFILQHLLQGAHFLDLCCGKGELVQDLLIKGYKVTGLDGSKEMLHYARQNAAGGEFILCDALLFKLPPTFHAVVSTHNALANFTSIEDLTNVFKNVYTALLENGWFMFDLSQEEEYNLNFLGSCSEVEDDFALISSSSYDQGEKIYQRNEIIFRLINGNWQRSDVTFIEKPYSPTEILFALEKVGFTEVISYDVKRDLFPDLGIDDNAVSQKLNYGRMCYTCRKK